LTAPLTRTDRLKLVAAVTALLILIGAGSAAAYWTAAAQLDGKASAARTQVSQMDDLDDLAIEYTAGALTTAGTTTIRNDGTAPGRYTLTVAAKMSTALARALTVSISEVATAEECAPESLLSPLVEGSLSPSDLRLSAEGDLAADGADGDTVILCVRTSLPTQAVFLLGDEQANISVTSSLSYADGEQWTVSPSEEVGGTILQSVAGDPVDDSTRMTCERNGASIWATANFSKRGDLSGSTFQPYMIIEGERVDLAHSKAQIDTRSQRVDVRITRGDINAANIFDRPGNYWVVVEQQSDDGTLTVFGAGKFKYELVTGVRCGW
jgi:hypothetical protein